MTYTGVIIEESLEDKLALANVKILKTKVEAATPRHKTPWVKQWTLHTVEIPDDKADSVAQKLSRSLDSKHAWYVDFKDRTSPQKWSKPE